MEVIISKPWGKEDELKALKSELAALDRKITAELAPKPEEADGVENKPTTIRQESERATPTQSSNKQEGGTSLVAEPHESYQLTPSSRMSCRIFGR